VFLVLAFYFSLVVPSEFGVPRPWHFPVTDLYAKFTGKKVSLEVDKSVEALVEKLEDADVKAERDRIDAKEYAPDSPLIINHLRKVYPPRSGLGPKIAVRDITLAAEKGVVLGLLGPNGGKFLNFIVSWKDFGYQCADWIVSSYFWSSKTRWV
jgi:hypothetical protein